MTNIAHAELAALLSRLSAGYAEAAEQHRKWAAEEPVYDTTPIANHVPHILIILNGDPPIYPNVPPWQPAYIGHPGDRDEAIRSLIEAVKALL